MSMTMTMTMSMTMTMTMAMTGSMAGLRGTAFPGPLSGSGPRGGAHALLACPT